MRGIWTKLKKWNILLYHTLAVAARCIGGCKIYRNILVSFCKTSALLWQRSILGTSFRFLKITAAFCFMNQITCYMIHAFLSYCFPSMDKISTFYLFHFQLSKSFSKPFFKENNFCSCHFLSGFFIIPIAFTFILHLIIKKLCFFATF